MILQLKREQYNLGKFRYVLNYNNLTKIISFNKINKGNITLFSNEFEDPFEMQIYPFFKGKEKNGTETKQLSGDFAALGGEKSLINYCGKKGTHFFNGIYYWTFETDGQKYIAYEVGFGRKGIYLCIWKDNQTVAIVSKDVHTKHFESNYTVYADNSFLPEMVCICSLFWDLTRYYPTESSEEYHTLNTWQKELKNKFDPTFIERIKALENNNG